MDTAVIITIIFLLLILVVALVTLYIESRKHIRRLEERIERLSSRLQAMSMKELDTVLKSVRYKKERDELCEILDEINQMSEAMEDGRQIKIMPKLPRTYLDKSNIVMTYEWEDGNTKYTSHYPYNPPQTSSQSDSTSSQDSSSYSGGGGDFSGSGSGGSWD